MSVAKPTRAVTSHQNASNIMQNVPLFCVNTLMSALKFLFEKDVFFSILAAGIAYQFAASNAAHIFLCVVCCTFLLLLKTLFSAASLADFSCRPQSLKALKRYKYKVVIWSSYISLLFFSVGPLEDLLNEIPFKSKSSGVSLPWYITIDKVQSESYVGETGIVLGPHGNVKTPYTAAVGSVLEYLGSSINYGSHYETKDEVSVIIPVRNEEQLLPGTLKFLFQNTPAKWLKEVIVVDDMSDIPVSSYLSKQLPSHALKKLIIIRNDAKEGLVRSRVVGANASTGSNLFFLDGHCKPYKGWLRPLLANLKQNYRRVACPVLYNVGSDWVEDGTMGSKMMFSWNFEFRWIENNEAEVPVSPGGIYAITRKWWEESGKYDIGMLEWGGENLEQSFRVWLCGGEVISVKESMIGHVFYRPPKPNPNNSLVEQVQKNQKRGAKVWLEEYYQYFYDIHSEARLLDEGDLTELFKLKASLKCVPFQWYADRFHTSMEMKGLLLHAYHHIQHKQTGLCLAAPFVEGNVFVDVRLAPCRQFDREQRWTIAAGGRTIMHLSMNGCLTYQPNLMKAQLQVCQWFKLFEGKSTEQFWHFDASSGQVLSFSHPDSVTLAGSDALRFPPYNSEDASRVYCLKITSAEDTVVSVDACAIQTPTPSQTFQILYPDAPIATRFRK